MEKEHTQWIIIPTMEQYEIRVWKEGRIDYRWADGKDEEENPIPHKDMIKIAKWITEKYSTYNQSIYSTHNKSRK